MNTTASGHPPNNRGEQRRLSDEERVRQSRERRHRDRREMNQEARVRSHGFRVISRCTRVRSLRLEATLILDAGLEFVTHTFTTAQSRSASAPMM